MASRSRSPPSGHRSLWGAERATDLFNEATDVGVEHPWMKTWATFADTVHGDQRELRQKIEAFLVYDSVQFRGEVSDAWWSMLSVAFPWSTSWRLADTLHVLALRVLYHRSVGHSFLDFVEFFSGFGQLTRAGLNHGLRGLAFDITYREDHNALADEGLRLFLTVLAGTKPGAMVWFGTPCSSFVVLCRAISLRHACNKYRGDTTRNFVRVGNALAAVTALTMLLADIVGCRPVLEQPLNSCLPKYSLMNCVLTFLRCRKVTTYLGAFRGPTLKPLQIVSSSSLTIRLCRERPELWQFAEAASLVMKYGKQSFTGQKQELKESEAYTYAFGCAVIEAFFLDSSGSD